MTNDYNYYIITDIRLGTVMQMTKDVPIQTFKS